MNEFTLERRLHNVNSVARVLSKSKAQVIVKVFTLEEKPYEREIHSNCFIKSGNLGRREGMHTSRRSHKYSHRRESLSVLSYSLAEEVDVSATRFTFFDLHYRDLDFY